MKFTGHSVKKREGADEKGVVHWFGQFLNECLILLQGNLWVDKLCIPMNIVQGTL